jgi:hypothetical protein
LVSKDLRQEGFTSLRLTRTSTVDANRRYHFRVGPGRYSLRSHSSGNQPLTVEVKNEVEIVRDLALTGFGRDTYFNGVVIEKTPTGDRPVARATIRRMVAGLGSYSPSRADEEGRFRMMRVHGESILHAESRDRSLAGMMALASEADNGSLVVSSAPKITGRVIDTNGKVQAHRSMGVRIESGPHFAGSGHLDFGISTDDQGRFTVSTAPVGSRVEVSVNYLKRVNLTTPRTVVTFVVPGPDPVEIPDLVVPVEKPTN